MKRTISAMVGKGSVNHNSRKFHAKNTDPERSHLNIEYFNEDIREVYHELFDDALLRYNEKQTRKDRKIDDYYEKIVSGKQEKPFHEIILQIGNRDDTGARTADGDLAVKVLDEYMKGFQRRNPNLRVFSAHLHRDEATPHLHIDFVPFTTGSKRGLETRVSLKQALAAMGFKGGTRSDTEWNQWVSAEKKELAAVMERNGIEWEQKGTLPEPNTLESAKAYRKRILPLINRVVKIIRPLYSKYYDLKRECERLSDRVSTLNKSTDRQRGKISFLENDNKQLLEQAQDLERVKSVWGASVVNEAIRKVKEYEQALGLQKNKNRRRSKGAR